MDSLSGNNCLRIISNQFLHNIAIQGGAIDCNLYEGPTCLEISQNLFLENYGFYNKSHIGSGSVVKVLMISCFIGPMKFKNNKYIVNTGEVKGFKL